MMLQVRLSRSLNFHFGAFAVLLALIHSCGGQRRVIGPSQSLKATVGDDVILPCHLDPAMNAFGMTLEWANPDLDPRFVYVWRDGVELESKKHPSYKGRTSMFVDELANGNISLRISKVKMSDAGRYRCFVPEVDEEAIVNLVVAQPRVIGPSQSLKAVVGDDIILPCHLDPAMNAFGMTLEWANPDLDPRFVYVWRDGVELESKKHLSYKGRTSMFVDELANGNISLRISKVKMSDAGRYRCFVPEVDEEAIVRLVVAQPRVIVPSQEIVATVGDDVILPCHLDPAMNAFGMTLEWANPDLDPRFVYVWRDGVELESKKHPSYKGRTSMFVDELETGNISLRISKVKMSDAGRYRCFVPEVEKEAIVHLVVGAASEPIIQMTKNSGSVDLQCDSTGWYPEPEVFWLDGEGNVLSAGPPETVRGPDDLYTVSSRVTVEKRHSNSFTCRVTQKKTNQTRETQIQVPDDFFVLPPGSGPTSPVPAIVGAVLGIMFILAVVAGYFLRKWRQNKIENKRRSLEDGDELPKEKQTEGEEESAPLMSGREDNNVKNESESEKEKLKLEAQRQTQQDQLMITSELITDMGGAGAEGDNERVSLIQTERETHQQQEMRGGQEQNDCVKEERQEKKKPDKEDSEPPTVSISEGQREQPHNLQTDQEEKKQEETEEEKIMEEKQPRREEDETEETSETKTEQKDNEQQREGKLDFRQMRKEKVEEQRRGRMQQKGGGRREDQRKTQLKKREEEKKELKPQKGQKQEASKLEPEDKKDKDQEGNQNDRTRIRDEESENRKEEINEKSKETESEERSREPQLERQELQRVEEKNELQTQKKNVEHEVSDSSKQIVQHKDEEENNSQFTGETERKADGKNGRSSENLTDVKNLERSREPQLESEDEPKRDEERIELPAQKKNDHQEVLGGSKQETELENKRSEGQETKLQESSKGQNKNQSKDTRGTERKAGGQNRQRNEKLERTDVEKEKGQKTGKQKVLHGSTQTTQHIDKEGNHNELTGEIERKADGKNRNEKLEKTDVKKEEGVDPSVSPAGPDRPGLRGHQETAERNKQEVQQVNELQEEEQQRDEPQRNERESKEQPERSAEVVEGKGRQEERTDGGADRDEIHKTSEEIEKHRQKQSDDEEDTGEQQTVGKRGCEGEDTIQTEEDVKTTNQDVQMASDGDESEPLKEIEKHRLLQSEVKEEAGEQLNESSKDLTQKREREAESLDGVKEEEETNERGFIHVTQRDNNERVKTKQKEEEGYHDHQQQTVEKRKPEEEDTVQTEEDVKTTNQVIHMEVEEAGETEKRVIDEPEEMDYEEDQEEEQMEF